MSFGDPGSFLFGLNHFSTPSDNNSPQAGGSNTAAGTDQQQQHDDLMSGIDPFSTNDILDGGSFADQLELWTNANFSFDGPTGHALLGDEDKEKEEAEKKKKEEDKDEEKRAGKRARNERNNSATPGFRGKGRQRDEEENDIRTPLASEPTHQAQKDQAALQQQNNYFAPPSRNAEEARRPGYDQIAAGNSAPSDRARSASQSESRPVVPVSSAVTGNAAFGQQNNGFNVRLPNTFDSPANGQAAANGFPSAQQNGGQVDLNSLLALQQLVAQNPLALASLGNFNGLTPQLGALNAQLNGLSALNGHNLQQLQMQMQLQQQNGTPQLPQMVPQQPQQQYGQLNGGYQNGWPLFNNQYSTAPLTGSMAAHVPTPTAPIVNGNGNRETKMQLTAAGAPDADDEGEDDKKRKKDKKKRQSSSGGSDDKYKPSRRERKMSSSEGNMSSDSGEANSHLTPAERRRLHEERAAERDQIPPLKLIDTGNPEADAEANRQAIEEDKRRRNTAASARFRVKKKQREAALEAHTKKLDAQLADLRDEVHKLRNENQWLKGLIEVRPGGKEGTAPTTRLSSGPEAMQAAQQLQALQHAVQISSVQKPSRSEPNSQIDRLRDTGIRPRGVGTEGEGGSLTQAQKRDREE